MGRGAQSPGKSVRHRESKYVGGFGVQFRFSFFLRRFDNKDPYGIDKSISGLVKAWE